jgi:hypothetical protein
MQEVSVYPPEKIGFGLRFLIRMLKTNNEQLKTNN